MNRSLLLGATGLVGQEILNQLQTNPNVGEIHVLARRHLGPGSNLGKVQQHIVDFERLDLDRSIFAVDAVFSAFGTTIKKAGSQEDFRRVDFEYPLRVAKLAKESGVEQFFLVSALGADAKSGVFYNRVKGELEDALKNLNFRKTVIVRPSVLIGDRPESRPAEKVGQYIGRFLPRTWRAVPATNVARALVKNLGLEFSGVKIIENTELFS